MNDDKDLFSVIRLHRDDLQSYLTQEQRDALSDDQMRDLAEKLGESLMDMFWVSLEVLVKESNVWK